MRKCKCVHMDPCVLQQQGRNTRDVTGRERERVSAYRKHAGPLNISHASDGSLEEKTAHIASFPSSTAT